MRIVIFDTETTGVPVRFQPAAAQPRIVQFALIAYDVSFPDDVRLPSTKWQEVGRIKWLLQPNYPIDPRAEAVHKISAPMLQHAPTFAQVEPVLRDLLERANIVAGHNVKFDLDMVMWELERLGLPPLNLKGLFSVTDTMQIGTDLCKIPGIGGNYKWPRLSELHRHLFGEDFDGAHDALGDVQATARCLQKMEEMGIVRLRPAVPTTPTEVEHVLGPSF